MKLFSRNLLFSFYKKKFKSLGNGTKINPTASIHDKRLVSIGENSFIGKWCHISIVKPALLVVGNHAIISPYTKILAGDHRMDYVGKFISVINDPINIPIAIENDTMIGMDAMVLKGVTIGEGAVIGAKAVVVKNVLPYTVAVGIPAKMIKLRFNLEDIPRHMEAINSRYDFNFLKEQYRNAKLI